MDILGSFVSLDNRRLSYNGGNVGGNNISNNDGANNMNSNGAANKTSFLIDDILFPAKIKGESTRQVKWIYS